MLAKVKRSRKEFAMSGRETPAIEWNERLGTGNGAVIEQMLHHFYANLITLQSPMPQLEERARPFLEELGVRQTDIKPLTLAELSAHPDIMLAETFGDIVWDWGNLLERMESCDGDDIDEGDLAAVIKARKPRRKNPLLEITNTAACILEDRLIHPTLWEMSRALPQGTVLPANIQAIMFNGLWSTLTHVVILLAIGDGDAAETIGPWVAFYVFGNVPLGIDEHGTFLFLTR